MKKIWKNKRNYQRITEKITICKKMPIIGFQIQQKCGHRDVAFISRKILVGVIY